MPTHTNTITLGSGMTLNLHGLWLTGLAFVGNSGSGKTMAARELIELTRGHAAQVIFDFGGELVTLREKFDYLLVAKAGGDLPADPAIAADLARFVREKKCHVIVDLSKLTEEKQQEFVQKFGDALLLLPEKLWSTPLLVFIDEVHLTCPQEERPASRKTVGNLSTLGRKQRILTVVASQRLAEVSKKLLGSINNRLYGRFIEPTDLKAACDVLGFGKAEWTTLRKMQPGSFYCMGPAFEGFDDVKLLRTSGKTQSRHIDRSRDKIVIVKPSKKVSLLAKDLIATQAKIAAETQSDKDELTRLRRVVKELESGAERNKLVLRIRELEGGVEIRKLGERIRQLEAEKITAAKVSASKKAAPAEPPRALSRDQMTKLREKLQSELTAMRQQYNIRTEAAVRRAFDRAVEICRMFFAAGIARLQDDATLVAVPESADKKTVKAAVEELLAKISPPSQEQPRVVQVSRSTREQQKDAALRSRAAHQSHDVSSTPRDASGPRKKSSDNLKRRIVIAIAQHGPLTRIEIGLALCMRCDNGHFSNTLGEARREGDIEEVDGRYCITDTGLARLGEHSPLPCPGPELITAWRAKHSALAGRQYDAIVDAGPEGITKQDLGEVLGIRSDNGHFSNTLGGLKAGGVGVVVEVDGTTPKRYAIHPFVRGDGR